MLVWKGKKGGSSTAFPVVPTDTQISWTEGYSIPIQRETPQSPFCVRMLCLQWGQNNLNNSLFAKLPVVNGEKGVMLLLVLKMLIWV